MNNSWAITKHGQPPKRPPFTGEFTVQGFDSIDEFNDYLTETLFCEAPAAETMETSRRRLFAALRRYGEGIIDRVSIWRVYRYCPALHFLEPPTLPPPVAPPPIIPPPPKIARRAD